MSAKTHLFLKYILILSLFTSNTIQANPLKDEIQSLIDKNIPQATVSIFIKNQTQNKLIYAKNADKLLMPASGSKLFPAAAALYQWPDNHHFTTYLAKKDANYYITFSGSPSLTKQEFYNLLSYFHKNNIQNIQGNIILDISRIKPPYYPNGTSLDDLGWYYAAPDSAVIIDRNALNYKFISAKKLGQPIKITPEQNKNFLKINNQAITVSPAYAKNHCEMHIALNENNQIKIYGCMPQMANPKSEKLAIPNPILYAENLIQDFLKTHNMNFTGQIKIGNTPKQAEQLKRIESDDLFTILKYMLQESDNVYASAITKQLGYAETHEGSTKQGIFAIKNILKKHADLKEPDLQLADGVGTRYNLITSRQIVNLLSSIYADKKLGKIFWKSLPIAGKAGTLSSRMQNSPLTGKVFAKTGSMHDVSSLSGYMINSSGEVITFSIITNNISSTFKGKMFEEQVLKYLYNNT